MVTSMFSNEKLNGLRYNVFSLPKGKDIVQTFPNLLSVEGFSDLSKKDFFDKKVRFIMLMYDKASPAIRMFQNVDQRKNECANIAGFDLEADANVLEGIFNFTDTHFTTAVVGFLKLQNSRIWSMIVSNEQTFYEYQKALLSEVTQINGDRDKLNAILVKSKLMEDSDTISKRLEDYYRIMFGDDSLVEFMSEKFTPEDMVKKRRANMFKQD